jgi:hypothetical protein
VSVSNKELVYPVVFFGGSGLFAPASTPLGAVFAQGLAFDVARVAERDHHVCGRDEVFGRQVLGVVFHLAAALTHFALTKLLRHTFERHTLTVNGQSVPMPLKEFELLEFLMRNSGRVLTRGQLMDRVWGSNYVGDGKTLDVHIKRIRSKIEPDPANPVYLTTVRGLGYRFEA